eukprot:9619163-Alexandrium_andersonii.AAC.1
MHCWCGLRPPHRTMRVGVLPRFDCRPPLASCPLLRVAGLGGGAAETDVVGMSRCVYTLKGA